MAPIPTTKSSNMNHKLLPCLLAATLAAAALPAAAQSAGEWTVGIGVHNVDPKSNNGTLANGTLPLSIGSSARPSATFEYFIRDNLGVEVLAAWPFEHDISVKGLGKVGSTKHLPPTVSLQYHFNDKGRVSPLIGAGVNFTTFFDSKTTGPLAGSDLSLASSWGLGVHAGLDFRISERATLRVDARWMNIESSVRVDGQRLGTAKIDPLVYGAAYVMKF